MVYYIVIKNYDWVNDETFEVVNLPTVVEMKRVKNVIDSENHVQISEMEFSDSLLGKIYLNSRFYNSPEEIAQ